MIVAMSAAIVVPERATGLLRLLGCR